MGWAALRTGDAKFYRAWRESFDRFSQYPEWWDHAANKALTNLPAMRAKLWGARLSETGLTVQPRKDIAADLNCGEISTPDGPVQVTA